jgi:hypothetical protein
MELLAAAAVLGQVVTVAVAVHDMFPSESAMKGLPGETVVDSTEAGGVRGSP